MGTEKTATDPHAEQITQLRSDHGPIAHFATAGQLFAFRTPSVDEWEDFEEKMKKGDRIGPAKRELCLLTLVYPAGKDAPDLLNKVFSRAPRAATLIGDELMDLAEGGIEVTVKKD